MVRVKPKKQKGDDAFEKRKQKVGRKKLAPATATRAEVHARTLRLATSSALAHAPDAPPRGDASRAEAEMAHHSFADLLAMSHHYKAASRASAFTAMAKALVRQEQAELAEGREGSRYAGFLATPAASTTATAAVQSKGKAAASTAALGRTVTPLEKLKAYAAALETITDTDEDARRAALGCLAVILRHEWVSSGSAANRGGGGGGDSSPSRGGSSVGKGRGRAGVDELTAATPTLSVPAMGATLDSREAVWAAQYGSLDTSHAPAASIMGVGVASAEGMLGLTLRGSNHTNSRGTARGFDTAGRHQTVAQGSRSLPVALAAPDMAEQDRVKAAMQAVHIALTHAMKGVRLAGVELLRLVLAHARPGAVLVAARAVYRQQCAYLSRGDGETAGDSAVHSVSDPAAATAAAVDPQERRQAEAREEEEWIIRLLKRLAQLVLRTRDVHVLPHMLGALLGPSMDRMDCASTTARPEAAVAADNALEHGSLWQTPELLADFFEEVLPQWSNAWKELMELQLGLLRQAEKLDMAVSLGQSFAMVLGYLKRAQVARVAEERRGGLRQPEVYTASTSAVLVRDGSPSVPAHGTTAGKDLAGEGRATAPSPSRGARLLSKAKQQRIRDLFIHRVPVSVEEILNHKGGSGVVGDRADSAATSRRVELALVLARVCSPLAATDEGWAVLERVFTAVFVGRSGEEPVQPPQHSPASLLRSLQLYLSVLRLFPKRVSTSKQLLSDSRGAGHDKVASGGCGGLWLAAAVGGNSIDGSSGSAVYENLIRFGPSVLQAVIKLTTELQQQRQRQLASDDAAEAGRGPRAPHAARAHEDATLAELLLLTGETVDALAHYPLAAPTGARATKEELSLCQALREVFSRVPRLLFALRPQPPAAMPPSAKRQREGDSDSEAESTEGSGGGGGARATTTRRAECVDAPLLADRPVLVDMIVHRLLQPLWFMASSGHPLLTLATTAPTLSAPPPSTLRDTLRGGLRPLFGFTLPTTGDRAQAPAVVEGVLRRCTPATVALAQETLFYLGVRDAAKMLVLAPSNVEMDEGRRVGPSAPATFGLEDVLLMLA